ncbi:hypothetical protein HF086_002405 [Spodoptera exigua]|uniref:Uncharacterized protein n=1 Tax=Spodoptera exigua TaxID=7107 RepID=A0A922MEW2_SPOEX|nr:hypothetical protein HF086_002405 [Spodoptera exigua]
MDSLNENYHLRKWYLQRDEVPTQRMMKKKMSPVLAGIYFQSMNQKLKRIVGLEPSLKGGGNCWYLPPEELLKGRAVLTPVQKRILAKLNHHSIEDIGEKLDKTHQKTIDNDKRKVITENDEKWRLTITDIYYQEWKDLSKEAKKKNTEQIIKAIESFACMYRQSIQRIESLCHEVVTADINTIKSNIQQAMTKKYKVTLKCEAISMTNEYDKKFIEEKAKLKAEFIENVENHRTDLGNQIHDIYVDKLTATENLKDYLKRLNLACQVYVALKEHEECLNDRIESEYKHQKVTKKMTNTIALQNAMIETKKQRENVLQDHVNNWRKKLFYMIKNFQLFVTYCLNTVPENAEFFLNLEKLMLLQINLVLEKPSDKSIFEAEEEIFNIPLILPKPFYVFCDKGYKAKVDHNLCPKHVGKVSASSSLLSAVIVNKHCLYAACDNFDQFKYGLKEYLHGNREDDSAVQDDHVYENTVPLRKRSPHKLFEVKPESSIMQVLQQEINDLQELYLTKKPETCNFCKMPNCSCTLREGVSVVNSRLTKTKVKSTEPPNENNPSSVKDIKLSHEKEPKQEHFLPHMESKNCACISKMCKVNPLPSYMTKTDYGPSFIPNYEICPRATLNELVKKARKSVPTRSVPAQSKKKDASTQYIDEEFNSICACFSDETDRWIKNTNSTHIWDLEDLADLSQFVDVSGSSSQESRLFAQARAQSLKSLFENLTISNFW